ncbi:unnamed protein product [Blepharisma stoltei]|uniref:Importin subunit alpha n=1 Tax=Blepharisma stoltei TaxID=1481888 RepID=A0AAU9K453_9CILI|nr:unnamed protein product [Blepharisma stoltei]
MQRLAERNNCFQQPNLGVVLEQHEQFSVNLRRKKRREQQMERRAKKDDLPASKISKVFRLTFPDLIRNLNDIHYSLETFKNILIGEYSSELKLEALRITRHFLTRGEAILDKAQIYAELGYIQSYIDLLNPHNPKEVQYEASWALCNLASCSHEIVEILISKGIIPACLGVINSESLDIIENAVWCLGNIAGDHKEYRVLMIKSYVFEFLVNLLKDMHEHPSPALNALLYALKNISRSIIHANIELVKKLLTLIKPLFQAASTREIEDLLTILYCITNGKEKWLQAIIDNGYGPIIIDSCDLPNQAASLLAYKALGNLLGGNVSQAEYVINLGAIEKIHKAVRSLDYHIRKEGFWALSNITAGSASQVKRIINSDLIDIAIRGLTENDEGIKYECGYVIANCFFRGEIEDIFELVNKGILLAFGQSIEINSDVKLIKLLLESAFQLLKLASDESRLEAMKLEFEKANLVDVIDGLSHHENKVIETIAKGLISEYFHEDDSDQIFLQDNFQSYEFS